jgi:hypothetical protein
MTTADRLHQAATKIRGTASAAAPGPWTHDDTGVWVTDRLDADGLAQPAADAEVAGCYGSRQEHDAAYIALMSPPVALAVADWLDATAADKTAGLGCIHPRAIDLTNLILGDTA